MSWDGYGWGKVLGKTVEIQVCVCVLVPQGMNVTVQNRGICVKTCRECLEASAVWGFTSHSC